MKFVIQRVNHGQVTVDSEVIGKIRKGLVVFIGVGKEDTREIADKFVKKLMGLRIFEDEHGKTNLSLNDVNGEILLISQFTLYADCRKGNRPSFIQAGEPQQAKALYEYIVEQIKETGIKTETGEFAADMKVLLENDGPFTIVLDDYIL